MKHASKDTAFRQLAEECASIEDGDSPIDLALTIAASSIMRGCDPVAETLWCEQRTGMGIDEIKAEFGPCGEALVIWRQVGIGPYTADILISVCVSLDARPVYIVVECDGHEFHERTKAQAAHDKKRDRILQSRGHPVLRFTGSEIWRSPSNAAKEMILAALDIAKERVPN